MPDQVLALLEELIRCQSVTPDDAGCQDIAAARLRAAGFDVEQLNFGGVTNLWATHTAAASGNTVCLAGHTDVVPPGPLEDWHSGPFEPEIRDGQLHGRGAADMKAGVAALLIAAERIAKGGHAGTIAVLLTSDEEGPSVHGTQYVLDTLAQRGTEIDAALVGEPTSEDEFGDAVKIGRRGSMNGVLVVHGIQGHTAYPQLADNAAHRLAPLIGKLLAIDWGDPADPFPATSLQISDLIAGTGASNVIPGRAEVRFNLRFGTNWTAEAIQARVAEALGTDEVAWTTGARPFLTETPTVNKALIEAITGETGRRPKLSCGGGTSDARFFAAHGIPVVEFGPLNKTIHAANECVAVACLEPLARIYERFARQVLEASE